MEKGIKAMAQQFPRQDARPFLPPPQLQLSQQQTFPYPVIAVPSQSPPIVQGENSIVPVLPAIADQPTVLLPETLFETDALTDRTKKQKAMRLIAPALVLVLAAALYFIWQLPASTSTPAARITQQNFGSSSAASGAPSSAISNGDMQVYVLGAVRHPGVYTLAQGARVYQLLQMAGGTLPQADLAAINLAAKLTDGQEVYVTTMGEAPPTYMGGVPGPATNNSMGSIGSTGGSGTSYSGGTTATGQPVNINTASESDMRQNLHISSTSAQKIIDYRLQHGNYTSIAQLAQVLSRSVYDKIRGMVTV